MADIVFRRRGALISLTPKALKRVFLRITPNVIRGDCSPNWLPARAFVTAFNPEKSEHGMLASVA